MGCPLKLASVRKDVWRKIEIEGFTWFGGTRNYLAHGVMSCAGIVWERRPGGELSRARGDAQLAKEYFTSRAHAGRTSEHVETGCRIAAEMLASRKRILARVARELCSRDLRPAELAELIVE